jgi:hypothetical protein
MKIGVRELAEKFVAVGEDVILLGGASHDILAHCPVRMLQ